MVNKRKPMTLKNGFKNSEIGRYYLQGIYLQLRTKTMNENVKVMTDNGKNIRKRIHPKHSKSTIKYWKDFLLEIGAIEKVEGQYRFAIDCINKYYKKNILTKEDYAKGQFLTFPLLESYLSKLFAKNSVKEIENKILAFFGSTSTKNVFLGLYCLALMNKAFENKENYFNSLVENPNEEYKRQLNYIEQSKDFSKMQKERAEMILSHFIENPQLAEEVLRNAPAHIQVFLGQSGKVIKIIINGKEDKVPKDYLFSPKIYSFIEKELAKKGLSLK